MCIKIDSMFESPITTIVLCVELFCVITRILKMFAKLQISGLWKDNSFTGMKSILKFLNAVAINSTKLTFSYKYSLSTVKFKFQYRFFFIHTFFLLIFSNIFCCCLFYAAEFKCKLNVK